MAKDILLYNLITLQEVSERQILMMESKSSDIRDSLIKKPNPMSSKLGKALAEKTVKGYVGVSLKQAQRAIRPRPKLSQEHQDFVRALCKRVAGSHLLIKPASGAESLLKSQVSAKSTGSEDGAAADGKKGKLKLGDVITTRDWLEEALLSACEEPILDQLQKRLNIEELFGELTLTEVLVALPEECVKDFLEANMQEAQDVAVAMEVVDTGLVPSWQAHLVTVTLNLINYSSPRESLAIWCALGSLNTVLGEQVSAAVARAFQYLDWPVAEKALLLSSMEESQAVELLADEDWTDTEKDKVLNKIHYGEDELPFESEKLIEGLKEDLIDDAYVRTRFLKRIKQIFQCTHDPDLFLAHVSHRHGLRLHDQARYFTNSDPWVKALVLDAHTSITDEDQKDGADDKKDDDGKDSGSEEEEEEVPVNGYNEEALARRFDEFGLSTDLVLYRRVDDHENEGEHRYQLEASAQVPELINMQQMRHARYGYICTNHEQRAYFFSVITNQGHVALRVAFNIFDVEGFCGLLNDNVFGQTMQVDYREATQTWEIPYDTALYKNFVDHFYEELEKVPIRESHQEPTFLQQGDRTILVFPSEDTKDKKDYLNFYDLATGDLLLKAENAWNLLDYHEGTLSLILREAKAVCRLEVDFCAPPEDPALMLPVPEKLDSVTEVDGFTLMPMLNGAYRVLQKRNARPVARDEAGNVTSFEYFLRECQRDKEENVKKMLFRLTAEGTAFKKEKEELQNDLGAKFDSALNKMWSNNNVVPDHRVHQVYNYPLLAVHLWTPQNNTIVVYNIANKKLPPLMFNLLNDRFVCFIDAEVEPQEPQNLYILCERNGNYAVHKLTFRVGNLQYQVVNRANPLVVDTEHIGYVFIEPVHTHKTVKAAKIKKFIVLQTMDDIVQVPIKPKLSDLKLKQNQYKSMIDDDGSMMRKLKFIFSYKALFYVQADKYNSNDRVMQVLFDESAKQLHLKQVYKAVGGRLLAMETELEEVKNTRRSREEWDRLLLIDDKLNLIHLDMHLRMEESHNEQQMRDIKTGRGLDSRLNGLKQSEFQSITWLEKTMMIHLNYIDTVNGFSVYGRSTEFVKDEVHGGASQSLRLSKNVLAFCHTSSEEHFKIMRHAATRTRSFIEDLTPVYTRHIGFIGDEHCLVQFRRKRLRTDDTETREWVLLDTNSQVVRIQADLRDILEAYDEAFDVYFEKRRQHNEKLAQNPALGEYTTPGEWYGSRFKRLSNGKHMLTLGKGPTLVNMVFHTNGQLHTVNEWEVSGELKFPQLLVFGDGTHVLVEFEEQKLPDQSEKSVKSGEEDEEAPKPYHMVETICGTSQKEGGIRAIKILHYSENSEYDKQRPNDWEVTQTEAELLAKTLAITVDEFLVWQRLDLKTAYVLHKDSLTGPCVKDGTILTSVHTIDLKRIANYEGKYPQEFRLCQPPLICMRYFQEYIETAQSSNGLRKKHSVLQVTQDTGHSLFHLALGKDLVDIKSQEIHTEDRETWRHLKAEQIVQPIQGAVRFFKHRKQGHFLQMRLVSSKNMGFSLLQRRKRLDEVSEITCGLKQFSEMNFLVLKKVITHCDDLNRRMDRINPRMFATAYNNQSIFSVLLSDAQVFPKMMERLISDVQEQNFEMESGRTDDLSIDNMMKKQIFSILAYNMCCTNLNLGELVQDSGDAADGEEENSSFKTSAEQLQDRGSMSLLQLSPHLKNLRSKELIYMLTNMFEQTSLSHLATNLNDFYAMLANSSINSNDLIEQSFSSTCFTNKIDTMEWKANASMAVFRSPTYMIDRETCKEHVQEFFARHEIKGEDALESVKVSMLDLQWLLADESYFSEFVKVISASKDKQIFATEFITIMLEEFWAQHCNIVFYQSFLPFATYLCSFIFMIVSALQLEQKIKDTSITEEDVAVQKIVVTSLGVVSLILQLISIKTEIGQMEDGIIAYLSSIYNIVDVLSNMLNLPLTYFSITHSPILGNNYAVGCASLATLLLWGRVYDWLRLFNYTAFYAKLVVETLGDIVKFLIVFVITLMSIGNALYILNFAGSEVVSPTFGIWPIDTFTNQWLLTVGEYALDPFEENNLISACYLLFLAGTFLTQVTFLNMLVAIMGDTFERVTESKDLYSAQNRLQIMADYSLILKKYAERLDNRYMFVVRPAEDNQGDLGVWDGNLASMKRSFQQQLNLMALKQDRKQHAQVSKLEEKLVVVQNKIDGMSGVEAIVKAIVGKIDNLQEDTRDQIVDLKKDLGLDKTYTAEEVEVSKAGEGQAIETLHTQVNSLEDQNDKLLGIMETLLTEVRDK